MRRLIPLLILILAVGLVHGKYTSVEFGQKTVTHAFKDSEGNQNILIVASDSKLSPSGMDTTAYNLYKVVKDKSTGQFLHYIRFNQKGVLRLKGDGKVLTIDVIDLEEQIQERKKQTEIKRLKERVDELESERDNLTLKVNHLNRQLLSNQSKIQKLERIIEQNQTVHDQVQFSNTKQAKAFGEAFAEKKAEEMSLNPLTHKGSSLVAIIIVFLITAGGKWAFKQTEEGVYK